jgi:secondary thiamine-phosphate synthase enzyme
VLEKASRSSTPCTLPHRCSSTTTRGGCTPITTWLERLAPHEPVSGYRQNRTGEDNADAHLKRQIMGREVVVAITAGKLDFGPWEQIFYGEFDGGRRKRVLIKIVGE